MRPLNPKAVVRAAGVLGVAHMAITAVEANAETGRGAEYARDWLDMIGDAISALPEGRAKVRRLARARAKATRGWWNPGYKRVSAFVAWVLLNVLRGKELP